ncbi:hypothetical protein [Halosegnis longus]|uniref:hypothetical protein n=1 Tax=Halosegnis longus TaxID=2216012 RepID=UPI00129E566E|nr:hypothetical protein [Halosegnis longus]
MSNTPAESGDTLTDDDRIDLTTISESQYTADDGPTPYPVPDPEWTPKQQTNWENHGQPRYDELESDAARYWYRRCYRPKKRGSGMMQRDHVKLGTPEDYIIEHVEDALEPMGSIHGVMMRSLGRYAVDKDVLDAVYRELLRTRLERIAEQNPDRARRLLAETKQVSSLYGLDG